jgi:hypothetical protein
LAFGHDTFGRAAARRLIHIHISMEEPRCN